MAFYNNNHSDTLRLGDVVKGYYSAKLKISDPKENKKELTININENNPIHFIVLTPCCSIEKNIISLSPYN